MLPKFPKVQKSIDAQIKVELTLAKIAQIGRHETVNTRSEHYRQSYFVLTQFWKIWLNDQLTENLDCHNLWSLVKFTPVTQRTAVCPYVPGARQILMTPLPLMKYQQEKGNFCFHSIYQYLSRRFQCNRSDIFYWQIPVMAVILKLCLNFSFRLLICVITERILVPSSPLISILTDEDSVFIFRNKICQRLVIPDMNI